MVNKRRQLMIFAGLLGIIALLTVMTFTLRLHEEMVRDKPIPAALNDLPPLVLGLANAGIAIVFYGLLGLAGFWFALKLGLPGIYRETSGPKRLIVSPMCIGLVLGVVLVAADRIFAVAIGWEGFPHPSFPLSLLASGVASIGEETLFRLCFLGLWAMILQRVLRGLATFRAALWGANVIAALMFAAAHLPSALILLGIKNLNELNPVILCELLLLNLVVGLVAGARFVRDGLVAAVGIHFWTDVVWHVLWPVVRSWG